MNPLPSPYQVPIAPPGGYWLGPIDTLLAPARRAGVLMIVLAGIGLLGGLCMIGTAMMPLEQLLRNSAVDAEEFARAGITPQVLKAMFIFMGSLSFAVSASLLVMGLLVRRGGTASAITSIVLVSLLMLGVSGLTVLQLVQVLARPQVPQLAFAGLLLMFLGLLVLLIIWLAAAVRSAVSLRALQHQQMAQWYAMQHHPAWTGYPPPPAGGIHS